MAPEYLAAMTHDAACLETACLDASSSYQSTISDRQQGARSNRAPLTRDHSLPHTSKAYSLSLRQQLRDRALPCALPAFYSKPISGSRRLPANTLAHDQIVNFPINALHFNDAFPISLPSDDPTLDGVNWDDVTKFR